MVLLFMNCQVLGFVDNMYKCEMSDFKGNSLILKF